MANNTDSPFLGNCLAPFLDVTKFPSQGGFIDGRMCAPLLPNDPSSPICCLPCPATDWIYSDDFNEYGLVSGWLNVVGLILLVFLLLSYAVLPTQQTRSHYLSVGLVVSVMMICIGFTIPLAAQPEECYNEITPNDMYSSMECAASGAFIVAGGLSVVAWILIRALSMNLQICFDIVPGRKFFYSSQAFGWGVPAALFTITMTLTGVSFRFGKACHVNHANSMADFWGPLLAMAGLAGFLQFATFGYCVKVYLKNLWTDQAGQTSSNGSSQLPSYSGSLRTQTARAVWRRLKKVLWLQWRGMAIASIILIDVIFFSIVFVYMDNLQQDALKNQTKIRPWILCLAENPRDKDNCLSLAQDWLIGEPMVVAVLLLLSLAAFELFFFLVRPSVFSAWFRLLRSKISQKHEFISLDARAATPHKMDYRDNKRDVQKAYEMQKPNGRIAINELGKERSSPETMISSPSETYFSPVVRDSPVALFNTPQSPSYSPDNRLYPGSPPVTAYNTHEENDVAESIDYFSTHRRGFRRQSSAEGLIPHPRPDSARSDERRYHAPRDSFSAPKQPSRQNSLLQQQSRELQSRGGLGLNPHAEVEAREAAEEAEFESWRRHDLWPRDDRYKKP